jgi:hypothetical protein
MTEEEAYRVGDRMTKPWKWCVAALMLVIAGLITFILKYETNVSVEVKAKNLEATDISALTTIGKE